MGRSSVPSSVLQPEPLSGSSMLPLRSHWGSAEEGEGRSSAAEACLGICTAWEEAVQICCVVRGSQLEIAHKRYS